MSVATIAIAFSILGMVTNPKNAKNALIGVGVLVVVCAIGYFMSGNEVHSNMEGDIFVSRKKFILDGFKIVELSTLDFEEFLLFEKGQLNITHSFNNYVKLGTIQLFRTSIVN